MPSDGELEARLFRPALARSWCTPLRTRPAALLPQRWMRQDLVGLLHWRTKRQGGGFSVLYVRAARLFDGLQVALGDGSFARRLMQMATMLDLLVIDDFAISPIGAAERNDLLEVLDDRLDTRSTLITNQLPVKAWHTHLNDPTLADAILNRVVHTSNQGNCRQPHKIELKAKSMQKPKDQP